MLPKLRSGFDAYERQRLDLVGALNTLNEMQLAWKQTPEDWSILQIVEHLVLSDELMGRASDRFIAKSKLLIFRVLPPFVRRFLVLSALKRNTVLPLPLAAMEPRGQSPLGELRIRWEAVRRVIHTDLDGMTRDTERWFHPALGPLTAAQLLDLGRTHAAYHIRQIEAIGQKQ